MCNLYSITRTRDETRTLIRALRDITGNQPPLPGIYPDYQATIGRVENGERTIANARWGLPSPVFALQGKKTDRGITHMSAIQAHPTGGAGLGLQIGVSCHSLLSRSLNPNHLVSRATPGLRLMRLSSWHSLQASRCRNGSLCARLRTGRRSMTAMPSSPPSPMPKWHQSIRKRCRQSSPSPTIGKRGCRSSGPRQRPCNDRWLTGR
jgi:hypothetical protein